MKLGNKCGPIKEWCPSQVFFSMKTCISDILYIIILIRQITTKELLVIAKEVNEAFKFRYAYDVLLPEVAMCAA